MSSPGKKAPRPPVVVAAAESTSSDGRFLRVVGWSYAMDAGQQLIGIVLGLVLAALLGPEAYGTVAMALVLVLFIDLFQQQGLAAAVVQRKDLDQRHLDSAFWMTMGVSLFTASVCVAIAGWWADANGTPELQAVVVALAVLLPLRALGVVQEALLRRRMLFKDLTIRTVAGVVVGGVVGLVAAFAGAGVWALVAQQLVGAFVAVAVLWIRSDWRPRWRFSPTAARELLGFSTGSFLSSLGVFINNKADALVIGLFFGPYVVGIYRFAARMVESVEGLASRPARSVALPELAPWQDDPNELSVRLHRLMRLSTVASLPLLGVLCAVAQPGVAVLGDEWAPAAAVMQLLCVVGAVRIICLVDGPLLQAVGRPHLQALITWLLAGASVATFVGAAVVMTDLPVEDQAFGIALSRAVLFSAVLLVVHVVLLRRFSRISLVRILLAPARPMLAGLAAATAGSVTYRLLPGEVAPAWAVLIVGAVAACAAAPIVLSDPTVQRLLTTMARRRGRAAALQPSSRSAP